MYTWTWVNVLESEQANQLNEITSYFRWNQRRKQQKKREEKLWRKKFLLQLAEHVKNEARDTRSFMSAFYFSYYKYFRSARCSFLA